MNPKIKAHAFHRGRLLCNLPLFNWLYRRCVGAVAIAGVLAALQFFAVPALAQSPDPPKIELAPGLAEAHQSFAANIAGDNPNGWGIYPVAQALLIRYRTTHNPAYLKTGLDQINQLRKLAAGVTGAKDAFTGEAQSVWLSSRYRCGVSVAFDVHNAAIAAPYLQLIYHMLVNEAAHLLPAERADIMQALAFFEANAHYFERRLVPADDGLALKAPDAPLVSSCSELAGFRTSPLLPLNMITAYGEQIAALFHVHRDAPMPESGAKAGRYRKLALDIAIYTKNQMHPGEAGSLTWRYMPGGRIEDVSHAIFPIRFLTFMKQIEPDSVSDEMIGQLVATFHFVYGNGAKDVKSHLSSTYGSRSQLRFIVNLGEWAMLAPYDKRIIPLLQGLYRGLYDDKGRIVVPSPLLRAMIEQARQAR